MFIGQNENTSLFALLPFSFAKHSSELTLCCLLATILHIHNKQYNLLGKTYFHSYNIQHDEFTSVSQNSTAMVIWNTWFFGQF
jgi:hypothetical protein